MPADLCCWPHEDAVPLGFLVAQPIATEWELENIVVSSTERRKGIGGRLMRALIDAASQSASESVFLEVRESNHPARHFYQKTGFLQAGVRKRLLSRSPGGRHLYRLQLVSC